MQLDILCFGNIKKNSSLSSVFEYYKKRIKFKINVIEMKTTKIESKKKKFESLEIFNALNNYEKNSVFLLDRKGKLVSSEELSMQIKNRMLEGDKKICFVIGGENGFELKNKQNWNYISFGRQTWPHILFRVMLIEQIYRCLEILKNSKYHK